VGSIRKTFWLGNDRSRAFLWRRWYYFSRDTENVADTGTRTGTETRSCEMKRAGIEGVLANLTVPKNWTALTSSGRVWITKISLAFLTRTHVFRVDRNTLSRQRIHVHVILREVEEKL